MEHRIRTIRDIPLDEPLFPGSSLCAGCGAQLMLRLMLKVMGRNVFIVNSSGCMTSLQTFPYSNLAGGWAYASLASAPAGAQGIVDTLDSLASQGKAKPRAVKVMVLAGDGASYDIGLQSTSAAMDRGLDFYYLCYDNEAYANTGYQLSGATPYGSWTTTTPVSERNPVGATRRKKDLFEIWKAHEPAYLATVSPSHPLDLMKKVEEAEARSGPKMFIGFASCPTGMGFDPSQSLEVARMAVETGVWPLKKYIDGKVIHTYLPNRLRPIEDYLRLQKRYAHLFEPLNREAISFMQSQVLLYWKRQGIAYPLP